MDRIARKTATLSIVIFASLALAVSCSQALELRDFVEQRVIAAKTPGSPQIVVAQGATEIASGGSIAIGSAVSLTSKELEFTISNPGTASLSLTGTPLVAITGTNQAEFSVAIAPSATVAVDGNTTFTLRFSPTSTGDKEITLTITNNTAVNPDFSFKVTASASAVPTYLLTITNDSNGTLKALPRYRMPIPIPSHRRSVPKLWMSPLR